MDRDQLDHWCERGILGLNLAILVFSPVAFGSVRGQEFVVVQWLTVGVLLVWYVRFWVNPKHLSNAGDLHWEQLNRQFDIESLALDVLPSFRARVAKPDAEIYRQAEERFGLEPRATVFIDDLAVNVDAARQRGWRGIHHLDHRTTIEDLRTMGVPA